MSLRTRILLTYATGITLLWAGLFWLRHVFPAQKANTPSVVAPQNTQTPSPPMSPTSNPTSPDGGTPQARVEAYIRDWFAVWQKEVEPQMGRGAAGFNFDTMKKWEKAISAVDDRHFSPSQRSIHDFGSRMGYPPDHHADHERVTSAQEKGDTAMVTTELKIRSYPEFYQYKLTKENGSWYIQSINHFFSDETEAAFTEEERTAILAKVTPDATLPELDRRVTPNCDRLFEEGRKVKLYDEDHALHVRSGGKLSVPSGVVGVRDFGYSPEDMRPLALRIPPGDYDMEYAEVRGTVVAARLVLDKSSPPVAYRPAPAVDEESHYVGVDAGNVAFFDAGTFMHLTKRGHEEHYQEDFANDTMRPDKPNAEPTYIHLGNPPSDKVTCIVVSSGHGDGGYPCYWGLDAQGKPVSLVVDFLVLAEFLKDRCKMLWPPANGGTSLTHPTLTDHGVSISLDKDDGRVTFHVSGEDFSRALWRSASGTVVADTKGMGYNSSGDISTYRILQSSLKEATEIEVELHAGYRN